MKEMIYDIEYYEKPEVLVDDIYKNYRYVIVNRGFHPCAYVVIPNDQEYGEPNIVDEFKCHGGITFCNSFIPGTDVCSDDMIIGWDYSHGDDYVLFYKGTNRDKGTHHWTTEELVEDVKMTIDGIIKQEV